MRRRQELPLTSRVALEVRSADHGSESRVQVQLRGDLVDGAVEGRYVCCFRQLQRYWRAGQAAS